MYCVPAVEPVWTGLNLFFWIGQRMDDHDAGEKIGLQPPTRDRDRVPATFDDLLTVLGEFGLYQKWIYFLCSLPYVFSSMQLMGWVFTGAENPVLCRDSVNSTDLSEFRNVSEISHCDLVSGCDSGFVYDTSKIKDSVTIEFDLVKHPTSSALGFVQTGYLR